MAERSIGAPVPRKEGEGKVTGAARYVDDLAFDDLLHGVTVRSPVQHGRLVDVRYGPGIPWEELVVVTAADVPGKNVVTLLDEDQPYLAAEAVHHAEEAVVLLAHPDRYLVEEARQAVELEIEPLPAVSTLEESLAGDTTVWGEDNLFKAIGIDKGDVQAAFAGAAEDPDLVLVEGTYRTGAQEQLYIEPQGMVARASRDEGVTVWGSLQCPFYVDKALAVLFGLPTEQVRVVQATTGGGFGGKEEYPSMIAGHAALLSWKAGGRPVKIVYDRAEDMRATTKRHPSRTEHRTLVDRQGRLVAMDVDFVLDGGAYLTLTPVVLSRGVIHATGPYRCEHVRIRGRAVATHLPPHGAFRGFGAPQSIFALERHLDRVAATVGLRPEELRRRNFLSTGDRTATGQEIDEAIDLPEMMDRALEEADWSSKRARFAEENARPGARVRRGLGLATFYHGSGFTGSGEKHLASSVALRAERGGRVVVLAASTEIGQGTQTIFAQIAADALGLPYEQVEVAQPDTSRVPDSGPTVASRTCMIVGKLVESAALGLERQLVAEGLLPAEHDAPAFARACDAYLDRHPELTSTAQYTPPSGIEWDDDTYKGSAYAAYGWAAYVASVAVDLDTWEVKVEDFVAVQDIGTVIHPKLAAGQVEGGVAQAIGFALSEKVVWRDGAMANARMTNYIMPTSQDLPPIRVHFAPVAYEHGPAGAKGVGELPMDGPAPAILNAVADATGLELDAVPLLPEELFEVAEGSDV